ncbi:MAG: preprotein translocase subunit SecE [Patescibacteria group bacterium]
MNKLLNYLKGTKIELKNVNWPSRKQTVNFTLLVIGVSLAVALFLGLFDIIFRLLIDRLVL